MLVNGALGERGVPPVVVWASPPVERDTTVQPLAGPPPPQNAGGDARRTVSVATDPHRTSSMLCSINQLSVCTGFAYRTIKARLSGLKPVVDGAAHLYETAKALPLLYTSDHGHDLQKERARLAHHQANREAIREREARSQYMPTDLAVILCQTNAEQARERLSSVVGQVASKHPDLPHAVLNDLERFIGDALAELPPDGVPDEIKRRINNGR